MLMSVLERVFIERTVGTNLKLLVGARFVFRVETTIIIGYYKSRNWQIISYKHLISLKLMRTLFFLILLISVNITLNIKVKE